MNTALILKVERHIRDLEDAVRFEKFCKEGVKFSKWKEILFFQKRKMERLDRSIKSLESDIAMFKDKLQLLKTK